jgi:hypothetical protein
VGIEREKLQVHFIARKGGQLAQYNKILQTYTAFIFVSSKEIKQWLK